MIEFLSEYTWGREAKILFSKLDSDNLAELIDTSYDMEIQISKDFSIIEGVLHTSCIKDYEITKEDRDTIVSAYAEIIEPIDMDTSTVLYENSYYTIYQGNTVKVGNDYWSTQVLKSLNSYFLTEKLTKSNVKTILRKKSETYLYEGKSITYDVLYSIIVVLKVLDLLNEQLKPMKQYDVVYNSKVVIMLKDNKLPWSYLTVDDLDRVPTKYENGKRTKDYAMLTDIKEGRTIGWRCTGFKYNVFEDIVETFRKCSVDETSMFENKD